MGASDDGPLSLSVLELEGASPVRIVLRGGLIPEVGAEFPTESRGASYMPFGAKEGYSTVTGLLWGQTEMAMTWAAAFMRRDQVTIEGLDVVFGPEGLLDAFVQLQKRGRECRVQLGPFSRRGVLRKVTPKPGRGYSVDPATGAQGTDGVNLEVTLSWEWAGEGEPPVATRNLASGSDLAGQLSGANAKLGFALADTDPFAPDFLSSLKGGIGRLRGGIAKLRKALQGIGDLARAPARLANEALAAARSLGNICNDFQTLLSDTGDDYKALGPAARGVGSVAANSGLLGASAAAKAAAKRSSAAAQAGLNDTIDVVAAMFEALDARKNKTIGVRPGQSLSDIARAQLGAADRWPEIAAANQITGQVVPKGTYQLELPARGR